jgi:hypothetical protein
MYTDLFTPVDAAKIETRLAEKNAARNWRFRNLHSKESKAVVSVLTSLVTFLFG